MGKTVQEAQNTEELLFAEFVAFASQGLIREASPATAQLNESQFAKMARDIGIICDHCSESAVDAVFQAVCVVNLLRLPKSSHFSRAGQTIWCS